MYSIGETYKIELKNKIIYTGKIIDEDDNQIKITDKYNQELIITKNSITQSKKVVE